MSSRGNTGHCWQHRSYTEHVCTCLWGLLKALCAWGATYLNSNLFFFSSPHLALIITDASYERILAITAPRNVKADELCVNRIITLNTVHDTFEVDQLHIAVQHISHHCPVCVHTLQTGQNWIFQPRKAMTLSPRLCLCMLKILKHLSLYEKGLYLLSRSSSEQHNSWSITFKHNWYYYFERQDAIMLLKRKDCQLWGC